jgi:hypothetical protein
MTFQPTLEAISEVNLIIEGTSQTIPVYSDGSSPADLISNTARISEGVSKGIKRFKDLDSFFNGTDSAGNKKSKFLSSFGFLPIVGGVLETLNFFLNGKKTSPTIIGYNSEYELKATGTEVFPLIDSQKGYLTPGSEEPNIGATNLPDFKTAYDNPLGVFTLLNTPVVQYAENEINRGNRTDCTEEIRINRSYKFDASSINYVVNTVAGLEAEPVSIQAALQFGDCYEGRGGDFFSLDQGDFAEAVGLFPNNDDDFSIYNTPMLNLDCLDEYTVQTEYEYSSLLNTHWNECETEDMGAYCDDVRLVLLVALKRLDGGLDEEIVLTLTYNVDLEPADFSVGQTPGNPFLGMDIVDINATCTGIPVPASSEVVADYCNDNYNPTLLGFRSSNDILESLSRFDNYNGSSTGKPTGPGKPGGTKPHIGDSDDANSIDGGKRLEIGGNEVSPISAPMTVSPNPTNGFIKVSPPNVALKVGSFSVYSMTGKLITSSRVALTNDFEADLSQLASGVYIVVLQDSQGNELGKERLVIK